MGVVAVIPARGGSKGIPDKNIKPLAGRPLLAYSIQVAQLAHNIDRVIVSTDSERYADIAREYGAEIPFLRPAKLAKDTSSDYGFIRHLLDWLSKEKGTPDLLVHLRPTTPFRDIAVVDAAVEHILRTEEVTSLRSVHEMSESAYKTFEIENNRLKCIGSGSFELDVANEVRQGYAKTFQANGYVDILKSDYVVENEKLHGDRSLAYITPHVVEVDTPEDFAYLEYQAAMKPELIRKLFG